MTNIMTTMTANHSDLKASLLLGSVLIIDDNLGIREALADILEHVTDREIFTAVNGQEGLNIIQEQEQPQINLIILDMNMPVLNGEQTYAKLQEVAPEAKVIISSSLNQIEVASRLKPHAIPSLLRKPYDIDNLYHTIKTTFGMA